MTPKSTFSNGTITELSVCRKQGPSQHRPARTARRTESGHHAPTQNRPGTQLTIWTRDCRRHHRDATLPTSLPLLLTDPALAITRQPGRGGACCEEGSQEGSRDLCKPAFCRPGRPAWRSVGIIRGAAGAGGSIACPWSSLWAALPLSLPSSSTDTGTQASSMLCLNQQQKRGRAGDRAKPGPTKVSLRLSCSYLL